MSNLAILVFFTTRRGGTLTEVNHRLLAEWAATCAEHVLPLFENAAPNDHRPRQAVELCRAWARDEKKMRQVLNEADSRSAARNAPDEAKFAALAAAQAVAVSHVAAHELGAAAYAIRAVCAASEEDMRESARCKELQWQRKQLPHEIRELVLDDQRLRNHVCWFVFRN